MQIAHRRFERSVPHGLVLASNDLPQAADCLFCIHWLAKITRPRWTKTVQPHETSRLLINEPTVVYSNAVRLIMNDLRTERWSDPDTAINEPGISHFRGPALLAKDLRCRLQDHPENLINDCQSLNKRSTKER